MRALLYVCFCLSFFNLVDGFEILVIGDSDSEDHDRFSEYINASIASLENPNVTFQYLHLPDDQNKAYTEVCGYGVGAASFIISVAEKKSVIIAVRSASYQSGIPTIQLQFETTWFQDRPRNRGSLPTGNTSTSAHDFSNSTSPNYTAAFWNVTSNFTFANENEGNGPGPPKVPYITMVPPWISILSVLTDFITRVSLTDANVFTDESYKRDDALAAAVSNTGLNYKPLEMATNQSEIRRQINDMKKDSTKTNLLIANINHLEEYFTEAKPEMETKRFNWFVFTKDPTALQCDSCTNLDMFSMTPTLSDNADKATRLSNYKDFVIKHFTGDHELYKGYNQLEMSFFLDLVYIAHSTYTHQNETGVIESPYICRNGSIMNNSEHSLNEQMYKRQFNGAYGDYTRFGDSAYFQNVPVSFRRCNFKDSRQCKKMGNWSAVQGIQEQYKSLLQDIDAIHHYRIATVVQPPFVEPKEGGGYQGYCIALIDEIVKIVNFTYTIYEVKDKMYGTINERNEWNGLIGELVSGEAEIALAPLSVMAERENYVDFTVPYYDLVGTTILMKKQAQDYSLFKFMTVLEGPVWGCIVGAYFFTSFLLWVFDRFSPYSYTNNKDKYKDDPEKREFTFKECLWFCMTSLTPQGGGEAPKNISGRLVAATWWLFGFIIIASYTANLAAFLTVSRLEMPIGSLDDLAKQYKIKYAPVRGTAAETYFKRMAEIEDRFYEIWKAMSLNESMTPQQRAQLAVWDYPVSDKFTNMWRYMQETGLPNSTAEAIEMVLKSPGSTEGFAYIGDATEIRYAELTDCRLQKVGNEFSRKPYAIAVQQYSPLKDSISSAILKLLNQRTLESLKETWWVKNPKRMNCPRAEDESDGISIQNIGGVFIVILVGIALSIITLAFEYWYYKDKRLGPQGNNVQTINGQNIPANNNNLNVKDAHGNGMNMGHFNSAFAAKE